MSLIKEHPEIDFSKNDKKLNDFIIYITSKQSRSRYVNFHLNLYKYISDNLEAYDKVNNVLTLLQMKHVIDLGKGTSFG